MISGAAPSEPSELARVDDRLSFLYFEHAVIARDANALTVTTQEGILHVPSAGLLVLLLGPGTNVTHQAMMVLADSGAAIIWVGERGVRYYAGGRPLARSSRLLEAQAQIVSNTRRRLAVARRMYAMRFPDEDTEGLTMQQLRGREGARVRSSYRSWAKQTGVKWGKREYDAADFEGSDAINQALSAANACLYGVAQAAIMALGCAPGLGIVHNGHDRSFVFDIADLYKSESSIPVAFQTVAQMPKGDVLVPTDLTDLATAVRRNMRDRIREARLIERMVEDIRSLVLSDAATDVEADGINLLWDERKGTVRGGMNYENE